jgi:hypothetical protein
VLGLYYELSVGNSLAVNFNRRSVQVRISHIGLDESFLQEVMDGQEFETQRKIIAKGIRALE